MFVSYMAMERGSMWPLRCIAVLGSIWHGFAFQASPEGSASFGDEPAATRAAFSIDAQGEASFAPPASSFAAAPLIRSSRHVEPSETETQAIEDQDQASPSESTALIAKGCSSEASELIEKINAIQKLRAKEIEKVERMEKFLLNARFGAVRDEVSNGTVARQYSEPKCYCLDAEDAVSESPPFMDMTCMTLTPSARGRQASCRSGFPFFRMHSNAMTADMCFSFCIGMGLDAFAIVKRKECRCGVTSENTAVWGGSQQIVGLISPAIDAAPAYTRTCHILAARFLGLVGGQTPSNLLTATDQEEKYIKSIIEQKDFRAEDDSGSDRQPPLAEGGAVSTSGLTGFMLVQSQGDSPHRYVNEPCTPGGRNCAPKALFPKNGDFVEITTYLQTSDLHWSDGRISKALPAATTSAFREAMRRVEGLANCIKFIEVNGPGQGWESYRWEWGLIVGKMEGKEDSCYLSSPRSVGRMSFINLGWCDSEATIGNMIHEIFHALGMNHEMKRPDAWETYRDADGIPHGPYLSWTSAGSYTDDSQLLPDHESYLGSTATGWAEYDFDSIMHYGENDDWDTVPKENNPRTGQRSHPSVGDIEQLCDYYHCSYTTTTSTTTTMQAWSFFHSWAFGGTARMHAQAFPVMAQILALVATWLWITVPVL